MVEQRACDWYHDDDGMLVLRARLMPDEGARLAKAIRALEASDTDVAISAVTAEWLCCDAVVVPMLEDGFGAPLAIGRRSRTIPRAIGRAMNARDEGCRFPGCNHTCFLHRHHIRHWAHQGDTSLGNLVTLCSCHRTLMHEGGFGISAATCDSRWGDPLGVARLGRLAC